MRSDPNLRGKRLLQTLISVLGIGSAALPQAAAAALMMATYEGTLVSLHGERGIDHYGDFGEAGRNLEGETFTVQIRFDTTLGFPVPSQFPTLRERVGGPQLCCQQGQGHPYDSPITGITFTVRGVTATFEPVSNAIISLDPANLAGGTSVFRANSGTNFIPGDGYETNKYIGLVTRFAPVSSELYVGYEFDYNDVVGDIQFEQRGGPTSRFFLLTNYVSVVDVSPPGYDRPEDGPEVYRAQMPPPPPPSNSVVPEPATWTLMIGGFGLAGTMLRRRRAVTQA